MSVYFKPKFSINFDDFWYRVRGDFGNEYRQYIYYMYL